MYSPICHIHVALKLSITYLNKGDLLKYLFHFLVLSSSATVKLDFDLLHLLCWGFFIHGLKVSSLNCKLSSSDSVCLSLKILIY